MSPLPTEAVRIQPVAAVRRAAWWLAPTFVILLLVGLAQTGPGQQAMRAAGLVKAPVPYTALYFTNSTSWPVKLPKLHYSLPITFGVHNATDSAKTYHWTVQTVAVSTKKRKARPKTVRVASGQLTLRAGQAAVTRRLVKGACARGSLQVIVRLASPARTIDFRTECGVYR